MLAFAPMARAQKPPAPRWEDVAAYYSGGNMKGDILYDWLNTNGTTGMPGSGNIRLNPKLKESRDAFLKGIGAKDYAHRRASVVLGLPFLSTLIHESLHNRTNSAGLDFGAEAAPTDLGTRLVPDLLQRFFGVKMDSRLGKEVTEMVLKNLRR